MLDPGTTKSKALHAGGNHVSSAIDEARAGKRCNLHRLRLGPKELQTFKHALIYLSQSQSQTHSQNQTQSKAWS